MTTRTDQAALTITPLRPPPTPPTRLTKVAAHTKKQVICAL